MNWLAKFFNLDHPRHNKYIKWVENVSKKCDELSTFMNLNGVEEVIRFDTESLSIISQLATLLGEWKILPLLSEEREKLIHQMLLRPVQDIFKVLIKKRCTKRDLCYILIIIVSILTRPEFNIKRDKINLQSQLEKYNLYCSVVERLFKLIILKLESIENIEDFNSIVIINPHYIAYAKVLSTISFRLPFVGELILAAVNLENSDELKKRVFNFKSRYNFSRPKSRGKRKIKINEGKLDIDLDYNLVKSNNVLNKRVAYKKLDKKNKRGKDLSTKDTHNLHNIESTSSLKPARSNFTDSKMVEFKNIIENATRTKELHFDDSTMYLFECWEFLFSSTTRYSTKNLSLQWLSKLKGGRSIIFVLFFQEWIAYIKSIISLPNPKAHFNWKSFKGYEEMELTFLSLLRQIEPSKLSDAMLSCTCELLSCNTDLINFYIKYIFTNTIATNRAQITDTFNKIKFWFKEFEKIEQWIPENFDLEFFCSGLDIIIQSDRYDLIIQMISLFYDFSHLFKGDLRVAFLLDFVLNKHFNTFFLHWNVLIRTYFMHFLIYKLVRIKLKDIANYGFDYNPPSHQLKLDENGYFVMSPPEELANDIKIHCVMLAYIKILEESIENEDTSNVYATTAMKEYIHIYSKYNPNEKPPDVETILKEKNYKHTKDT